MWRRSRGGIPDVEADQPPLYEKESKFVTVKLYHGGKFTKDPLLRYKGGEFDMFDFVTGNELCKLELNHYAERVGYCGPHRLYYCLSNKSMDEGLRYIETNIDVRAMVDELDECMKIVEVFRVAVHDFDPLGNCLGHCDMGCDEDDDSSDPETVADSDYDDGDDDQIYDSHVDMEVEAGGWTLQMARKFIELPIDDMEDGAAASSGTDCGSVSGLYSHDSNSDGNCEGRKRAAPQEFDVDSDTSPHFSLGMQFGDKAELVKALRNYSVAERREFKLVKNDKIRVYARCYSPCTWELTARKVNGSNTFTINSYNDHHMCSKQWTTRLCNSSLVAEWYVNDFANNPDISLSHLMFRVQNEKKVKISKSQAWKAKRKALEKVRGKVADQFSRLHDYVAECVRANPGSTFVIKTEDEEVDRFKRIYVCWSGIKKGFRDGCRKLIGIDGCHLKGNCTGILLAAVAMDANNCTYPVAYALVEIENKETWLWFLRILIDDLEIVNHPGWVIISDRQKGLIPAVAELLPRVSHRYCVQHFYKNFKVDHPGLELKRELWKIAKATFTEKHKSLMKNMRDKHNGAYEWLNKEDPKHWCRSYFGTEVKCDLLVNNICEGFNAAILPARNLLVIGMLEWLRIYLTNRLRSKREWARNSDWIVCPKIRKRLDRYCERAAGYACNYAGDYKFEVSCAGGGQFAVNLNTRSCACKKWDLTGIPCSHAIAAILENRERVEQYLSDWYFKNTYLCSYTPMINPINGQDLWPRSSNIPLQPPYYTKQPGRPKKARRRALDSPIRKTTKRGSIRIARAKVGHGRYQCGHCKKTGHNKTTCPDLKGAKVQADANVNAATKMRKQKTKGIVLSEKKAHKHERNNLVVGKGKKPMAAKMQFQKNPNGTNLAKVTATTIHINCTDGAKGGGDPWAAEFDFGALTQEDWQLLEESESKALKNENIARNDHAYIVEEVDEHFNIMQVVNEDHAYTVQEVDEKLSSDDHVAETIHPQPSRELHSKRRRISED